MTALTEEPNHRDPKSETHPRKDKWQGSQANGTPISGQHASQQRLFLQAQNASPES